MYGMGIVVGLLGLAAAFFGLADPLIRSIGILMCLSGAYLLKAAKARGQIGRRYSVNQGLISLSARWPRRWQWILATAFLAVSLVLFFLMNNDALRGYHHDWIPYAFILSCTIFMIISSSIIGILLWKLFKH